MLFQVEEIVTWRDWDAYRIASALHGKVTGSIMRGLWGFQRALGLFFCSLRRRFGRIEPAVRPSESPDCYGRCNAVFRYSAVPEKRGG